MRQWTSSFYEIIRRLLLLVAVVILSFDVVPTGVEARMQCPRIKEAIAQGLGDYNQTTQGWPWFQNRGLSSSKHYGCRKPTYEAGKEPRYNFALDCQCPAWSQCTGDTFEYQTSDGKHNYSQMGTCGCCAWWLIFLIVIFSLLILASIIKWKWFRDRYREYKKKHRKGGSFKDRGFDSLDDRGEGGGESPEAQELKVVKSGGGAGPPHVSSSPDRLVLPLTKKQQAKYQADRKRSTVRVVDGEGYATTHSGPGSEGLSKRGGSAGLANGSNGSSGSRKLSLLPDVGIGRRSGGGGADDDGRGSSQSSRGSMSGSFGGRASGSERPQTPPLPQPGSSAAQILAMQRQSLGVGVPSAAAATSNTLTTLSPPTHEQEQSTAGGGGVMDRSESPGSLPPPNVSLNETQEFRKSPEPKAFTSV